MRRLVLILLIVFLPLQAVWGAAGSYCRHEAGVAAKHFGHHEHKHSQGYAEGNGDGKAVPNLSVSGDFDCATCDLTSPTLPADLFWVGAPPDATPQFSYHRSDRSHIPAEPERPDRVLA